MEKKKTALQQLIDIVENSPEMTRSELFEKATELLQTEREQLENAHNAGRSIKRGFKQWFYETYETE